MRLLFLSIFIFFSVSFVYADEGSMTYPSLPCASEKILCQSYQDKNLCDQYLNDPNYVIAGGSVGASVQNYEFCPKKDLVNTVQPSMFVFIVLLGVIIIAGIIALTRIHKKTPQQKA